MNQVSMMNKNNFNNTVNQPSEMINKTGNNFDAKRTNRARNDFGNVKYNDDEINEARESLKMLKSKMTKTDTINQDNGSYLVKNNINSTLSNPSNMNNIGNIYSL